MAREDRFDVELTRNATKDLKVYKGRSYQRAMDALSQLETEPDKGHTLTGSLRGARSLEFSLPGGAHRAAYVVLSMDRVCVVFLVGSHEGFYKEAERRYEALRKAGRA